jgi:hypothetical protein
LAVALTDDQVVTLEESGSRRPFAAFEFIDDGNAGNSGYLVAQGEGLCAVRLYDDHPVGAWGGARLAWESEEHQKGQGQKHRTGLAVGQHGANLQIPGVGQGRRPSKILFSTS